ncbi:aminopeptidase P family protein [Ensifer sesbaniae]|jgi:Xaa-Pro aminopeptidase|uniref:M24 family metallopeptidase n=1 Tax=Ensifer sesbaniae TaxID=1214071 RepID=UPI00156A3B81|nr:aminopeptidase P family protein [Ensifer sesbaniae]MCK3776833.1 aminopeptidase P family protein [Ensifer sesbaniae]NRQ15919.1 putative dipeptidase PepE [Ensifer sesbaniae]
MTELTKARFAALRRKMAENDVGLIALAPGSHMDWLIGYHPHPDERPCLLLIGPEREAFLMPALNAEGTREHTDIAFHNWADDEGPAAALTAALADIGAEKPGRVVLDETMRADFALLLIDALPEDTAREFTPATLGSLRMRKDKTEYELLKMNAGIADRAMQAAFSKIRPGMTEKELAAEIRGHFSSEGAAPAFWIVGAGGNGAFPHHSASERVIEEGDAVVIDIGGRKQGFPSDITRMAIVGRAPEGYGQIHTIVEKAVQAAMKAARPGVLAKDVDAAARKVISDAGYGEYFVHRTGHGMGIDGHEPPYITATSETVLEEGMVFSIEPGIYLPGRFGIRLEDIVILREDGPEVLSSLSRDVHVAKV